MDNLLEYTLGGIPNIDDAATILPNADFTSDWLTYIYSRRRDATERGLDYDLFYKLDLGDTNDWVYIGGAWETETNTISPEFESITNEMDIAGQEAGYIRLEITENP